MDSGSFKTKICEWVANNDPLVVSSQGMVLNNLAEALCRDSRSQAQREARMIILSRLNELADEKVIRIRDDPNNPHAIYGLLPAYPDSPPLHSDNHRESHVPSITTDVDWTPVEAVYRDITLLILAEHNGTIEDSDGRVHARIEELTNLEPTDSDSAALKLTLNKMRRAGLVDQVVDGDTTRRISLTIELSPATIEELRSRVNAQAQETNEPKVAPGASIGVVRAYTTLILLELHRHGDVNDEGNGFAALTLLNRMGFPIGVTPTHLSSALTKLDHTLGLINRTVNSGSCSFIGLKQPLGDKQLVQLTDDETAAYSCVQNDIQSFRSGSSPSSKPAVTKKADLTLGEQVSYNDRLCKRALGLLKGAIHSATNGGTFNAVQVLRQGGLAATEDINTALDILHALELVMARSTTPITLDEDKIWYIPEASVVHRAAIEKLMRRRLNLPEAAPIEIAFPEAKPEKPAVNGKQFGPMVEPLDTAIVGNMLALCTKALQVLREHAGFEKPEGIFAVKTVLGDQNGFSDVQIVEVTHYLQELRLAVPVRMKASGPPPVYLWRFSPDSSRTVNRRDLESLMRTRDTTVTRKVAIPEVPPVTPAPVSKPPEAKTEPTATEPTPLPAAKPTPPKGQTVSILQTSAQCVITIPQAFMAGIEPTSNTTLKLARIAQALAEQIKSRDQQIAELQATGTQTSADLTRAQQAAASLKKEVEKLTSENTRLAKELTDASNPEVLSVIQEFGHLVTPPDSVS